MGDSAELVAEKYPEGGDLSADRRLGLVLPRRGPGAESVTGGRILRDGGLRLVGRQAGARSLINLAWNLEVYWLIFGLC